MKRFFLQFLILTVFVLSGFFVLAKPVSAIYATTTHPYYTNGYNFRDVGGIFVTDEHFWFDGEHYRYSFIPARDFYTPFFHYGDYISKGSFYFTWLSTSYSFEKGGGGGSGAYFVENMSDFDGYSRGPIFFLWEKDHHYDTYIIEGTIAGSGLTESNFFLNWHFKDYPNDRLRPEYSHIRFGTRYIDYINYNHPRNYIDYDYSPEPEKLDPVIIIPGILGSWNFGGGWQLDPIFNTYDNLWSALKSAGYEEGVNLFALPYDWNNSNVDTARFLKDKIDEVRDICDCDKVDIVAHSMGGLVARAYVEMGYYENDIDQLIFLATPHYGSPKSYLMWEGGEFGQKRDDFLMERIFALIADSSGYDSIFDLIRNHPIYSIEELLPIYDYLKRQDDNSDWQVTNYNNNYPQNEFLEALNSADNLAKLDNINITNIIASAGESSTINYLKVIDKEFDVGAWEYGYPNGYYSIFGDHGLEYSSGDQTVPSRSNSGFLGLDDVTIESNHDQIVTNAQKLIIKELTGVEPGTEIRKNIFSKYLMIRIFSPADFIVIAPNGQRVGKDFINNQAINEIDGAFYSGFDSDMEFALIPDPLDGDYKIELAGTGDGEYKLSTSLIGDDLALDSDYNGFITLGDTDNYSLAITDNEISTLNPNIKTIAELAEEIAEMYQKGWLNYFGSKNALLSLLKNGFKNEAQFNSLNKFLADMLEKDRINQQAYDIIKSALINIKNNL